MYVILYRYQVFILFLLMSTFYFLHCLELIIFHHFIKTYSSNIQCTASQAERIQRGKD